MQYKNLGPVVIHSGTHENLYALGVQGQLVEMNLHVTASKRHMVVIVHSLSMKNPGCLDAFI